MSRDIKDADDWRPEFNKIEQNISDTQNIITALSKWIWNNVVAEDVIPPQMPSEVSEILTALDQKLREIDETNSYLRWYFCGKPIEKMTSGQQLSREEYYLLAAYGVFIIPTETCSKGAYEEFKHHFYEDNKQRGYINPSEKPDPPPVPTKNGGWIHEVHFQFGIVPEEVRTSFLREEQKDFFRKFKPELFSRFRKD
jgi:hypothetical protein